ncbi:OmpA family protein [Membranihabitans maritimus]|uniref:OmpA family protein n=1 Tax=Membranihabitans maritimus TaxID=2904244 RepID=UPI001F308FDB|nr:OmpA family protein [Membranihabitans maritimus]
MKTIVGILAFLWFVGWGYWFLYERGHIQFDKVSHETVEIDLENSSNHTDTARKSNVTSFTFTFDSNNLNLSSKVDSLYSNLQTNEAIQIISYYTEEESFSGGSFETLGIKRSEDLVREIRKKYSSHVLLPTGIKLQPSSGIDTTGISHYYEIQVFNKDQPLQVINNERYFVFYPFASEEERGSSKISDAIDSLTNIWGRKDYQFIVTGHTDSEATETTNYRLGMKRAKSIQDKLIQNGIAPEDITILSKGEQEPIASNLTAGGRYLNRRAEILLQRK